MDTTQSSVPTFAPLAFSLSIRSEDAAQALARNAVDPLNGVFLSGAIAFGAAAAVGFALYSFLPAWMSIPLSVWPGFMAFRRAKRYFDNEHPKARVQANRAVLLKAVDADDAERFATVVEPIVSSQYGNQKWALATGELRRKAASDPYLYMASVFTYAPECWGQCTRRVYELHLNGVLPDRA